MEQDQVKLDEKKFEIKCTACGCTRCEIVNDLRWGSEQTGGWGEIEIVCPDCKAREEIYSL